MLVLRGCAVFVWVMAAGVHHSGGGWEFCATFMLCMFGAGLWSAADGGFLNYVRWSILHDDEFIRTVRRKLGQL